MLLMIIPILLITILIVQAKDGSIFTIAGLMNYFGFYNMFMGVVYATYGGYVSLSIDEYEFSIFSKSKVLLLRIISGMLVAMASVLCILLVMSVVSIFSGITLRLFLSYVLYAFIKCFTQIIVLFSIGFLLGTVIKNRLLYIATAAVSFLFSPLFDVIFNIEKETAFIRSLFNLSFQNPNYSQFAAVGKLDQSFLANSLFWILTGVLLIICIVLQAQKEKRKNFLAWILPSGVVILSVTLVMCNAFYPVMLDFNSEQRQYYKTNFDKDKINIYENHDITKDYYITNMTMDLYLGNNLKNECRLTVHKSKDTKYIKLRIDEAFDATAYYYGPNSSNDGFIIQFRDGDNLYIETDPSYYPQDDLEIVIKYSGNLNYQNYMYSKVFYSTSEASNLYHQFAWYPQIIENNNEIDFDVTVHANNSFVSNLTGGRLIKDKTYSGQARLRQLYIISGYFEEVQSGGINCIIFEGYKNSKAAIDRNVQMQLDFIKEYENEPENNMEYIVETYGGGSYTQPYDSSKIKTIIYCPFYFQGFILHDQYEDTFFVNEII